jgi:5-methylcytosine-specific restriction endonuclease McrA
MSNRKKEIRLNFRNGVLERDQHMCKCCGKKSCALDPHHITDRNEMPNGGYVIENGISVCDECHIKAEVWHNSGKTESIEGYHPDDLYKLIGSNYELAYRKSKQLGN